MNDLLTLLKLGIDVKLTKCKAQQVVNLIELQQQTIAGLCNALDDTLYDLEQCEVLIDSIRGSGRDIREIEQDDDLPISIIEARQVLAKARGQQ